MDDNNTDSNRINLFEEELINYHIKDKQFLSLTYTMQIKLLDENNESRVNLTHIPTLFVLDKDKKGYFVEEDFIELSTIVIEKEKQFKRYELNSKLIAFFNLMMLKDVCSSIGEAKFVTWILNIFKIVELEQLNIKNNKAIDIDQINTLNINNNDSIDSLSKETINIFYELMSIKQHYNITFEVFYDLMIHASLELEGQTQQQEITEDEKVKLDVLDLFATQYVRGFCKLIVDIGYDDLITNNQ
jgi:hypothetical protein